MLPILNQEVLKFVHDLMVNEMTGVFPLSVSSHRVKVKRAFTFVEVLIAISLIGVITTGAVAPLVHLVNSLRQVESDFVSERAVHKSISLVFRDFRKTNICPSGQPVIIKRREISGDRRRDVLVFWTVSPSGYEGGAGSMVYMVYEGDWGRKTSSALYRWFLPTLLPAEVQIEKLDMDSSHIQLVLPEVEGLSFEIWDGRAWTESYQGPVPAALKATMERDGNIFEFFEWIPR